MHDWVTFVLLLCSTFLPTTLLLTLRRYAFACMLVLNMNVFHLLETIDLRFLWWVFIIFSPIKIPISNALYLLRVIAAIAHLPLPQRFSLILLFFRVARSIFIRSFQNRRTGLNLIRRGLKILLLDPMISHADRSAVAEGFLLSYFFIYFIIALFMNNRVNVCVRAICLPAPWSVGRFSFKLRWVFIESIDTQIRQLMEVLFLFVFFPNFWYAKLPVSFGFFGRNLLYLLISAIETNICIFGCVKYDARQYFLFYALLISDFDGALKIERGLWNACLWALLIAWLGCLVILPVVVGFVYLEVIINLWIVEAADSRQMVMMMRLLSAEVIWWLG